MPANAAKSRSILIIGVVAGLLTALLSSSLGLTTDWVASITLAVFAVSGVVGLVVAALLGAGVLKPSPRWGSSPVGQALQGIAWLSCAFIGAHESFGVGPMPRFAALLPAVVLVVGFRIDQQARVQSNAV